MLEKAPGDDELRRRAAEAALSVVEPGMKLGIGTGRTAEHFVRLLAGRVRQGLDVVGVPTSQRTADLARAEGVPLTTLDEEPALNLTVDGADEVDRSLRLIKGGGGALTREKVLAGASRRFVCIVDDSKLVGMLGEFPLPIEVIPMAQEFVAGKLVKLRGRPVWREDFVTDNGNHILDVHGLQIGNPIELESRLNQVPGIVTVGIFAQRPADVLLIAGDDGVRELRV